MKKRISRQHKQEVQKVEKLTLFHGFCSKIRHFSIFSFLANIGQENVFFLILQNEKTHFQAIKTRSSKSQKTDISPKGLTNGFAQKLAILPSFFFQSIQASKMCFMIFQNEKTHFQAIKTRSTQNRKVDIFPKPLTHGFAQKLAILSSFFFQATQARKISFMIFQNKKAHFQAIKTRSSKSQKLDIFGKGLTHWFAQKFAIFRGFFFSQYRPGKCVL